jgi:hypothetical protein
MSDILAAIVIGTAILAIAGIFLYDIWVTNKEEKSYNKL